jgi:hypothetical protein
VKFRNGVTSLRQNTKQNQKASMVLGNSSDHKVECTSYYCLQSCETLD